MEEFEMIANDDMIKMMNREFQEVENRKNMVENKKNHSCYGVLGAKCGTEDIREKKLFERIYFLEQDMIMMLRKLHTIAPMDFRDEITNAIKIKMKNSNRILKCYYNVTDNKMSYSANLAHDNNYCRLLWHIMKNQRKLLVMLDSSKRHCVYIKKVIQSELTCGYILNSIACYCK